MNNEQKGYVNMSYDLYPNNVYSQQPFYRSDEDFHGDQRFPFLPILGGIAGGLLAGAFIYPPGGGYGYGYGPGPVVYYPAYPPYPTYPSYPPYPYHQNYY